MADKTPEERIGILENSYKFIQEELADIKGNHLKSIYGRLGGIELKLNARPTWLLSLIIAGLCSLCTALIIAMLMKG